MIASINAGVASNAAGNANTASNSTDNSVTFDNVSPSVTIDQASAQADPTNVSPVNFTVVFSEPVSDFATGDVTLSGTAGATTATVSEVAPNDGTTYNVAVSGMTGSGTVIASISAGVASDAAGNANTASTSTDNEVAFDNAAPTVTIDQASGQADPVNASPINFTVVFSEAVSNFATGDVAISGTAGATTAMVTGSGTTYNVAVSGMTGSGTVIASIAAGVASDAAGNANTASTSTDNSVQYNAPAPPPPTPPQIIDNRDAGWSLLAGAGKYSNSGGYAGDWDLLKDPDARWTFDVTPGTYRVSVSWRTYNYFRTSTTSPFHVFDGPVSGAPLATMTVDQRFSDPIGDVVEGGKNFQDLDPDRGGNGHVGDGGIFTINCNTLTVQLTGVSGSYVIADAVRIERLNPLHSTAADDKSPSLQSPLASLASTLTVADVAPHLDAAVAAWSHGDPATASALAGVQVQVANLPGNTLGLASYHTGTIWLDTDAAGQGWRIEAGGHRQQATGGHDLFTVVAHELGHVLGLPDLDPSSHPDSLMAATLPPGVRRSPVANRVENGTALSPLPSDLPGVWDSQPLRHDYFGDGLLLGEPGSLRHAATIPPVNTVGGVAERADAGESETSLRSFDDAELLGLLAARRRTSVDEKAIDAVFGEDDYLVDGQFAAEHLDATPRRADAFR